jgi:hypothetical protein
MPLKVTHYIFKVTAIFAVILGIFFSAGCATKDNLSNQEEVYAAVALNAPDSSSNQETENVRKSPFLPIDLDDSKNDLLIQATDLLEQKMYAQQRFWSRLPSGRYCKRWRC